MSLPLDMSSLLWYATKQERCGRPLTLACTRGPYGKCTRCGVAHHKAPATQATEGHQEASWWALRSELAGWKRQQNKRASNEARAWRRLIDDQEGPSVV